MMKVKRVEAAEPSGNGSEGNDHGDSSETEKQKLKKQISDLRALISQAESSLDITRFRDIKKSVATLLSLGLDHRAATKVPNTNTLFRNEIYRYSGFYCAKMDKGEYIFKYAPSDEIYSKETYWVQIFNKDGKGSLGKWVMPMWIDMDCILTETPIDDLSNIVRFLKNWRLHIDCHTERKTQLCELKNFAADSSSCVVDANLNFTLVTLQLFGVHDATKDIYTNLTVYLSYKQNETTPYKITTERGSKQSSSNEEKELKAYTKCLKNHRLPEGFRLMTESSHPVFSWTMNEHDDSLLELNVENTSDSDEETILDRVKLDRKKSRKKRRKHRQSSEKVKRRKGKGKAVKSGVSVDKENAHSLSVLQSPLELRENDGSHSVSENRVEGFSGERKLAQRQTTISFPSNSASRANAENLTIVEVHEEPDARAKKSRQANVPKPVKKVEKKLAIARKPRRSVGIQAAKKKIAAKPSKRATTSTPLAKRIAGKVKFAAISDVELSPIVSAAEDNDK